MFRPITRRLISSSRTILKAAIPKAPTTANSTTPSGNTVKSSCLVGTPLNLNIRKGQKGPVALEDSEYPDWLWTILDDTSSKVSDANLKELSVDEQLKLRKKEIRKENRKKIKQSNFISQL